MDLWLGPRNGMIRTYKEIIKDITRFTRIATGGLLLRATVYLFAFPGVLELLVLRRLLAGLCYGSSSLRIDYSRPSGIRSQSETSRDIREFLT